MKFKTTKKNMKQNYNTIITIGYCTLQYLLQYVEPIAYSAGADGWQCDYYDVGNVLICTGYNPISAIRPPYEVVEKYNNSALSLVAITDWNERKTEAKNLLKQFVNEAIQ